MLSEGWLPERCSYEPEARSTGAGFALPGLRGGTNRDDSETTHVDALVGTYADAGSIPAASTNFREVEQPHMSEKSLEAQSPSSPDPGTDSMFERTLKRSPAQRLADAARIARFVLRGREKVRAAIEADG